MLKPHHNKLIGQSRETLIDRLLASQMVANIVADDSVAEVRQRAAEELTAVERRYQGRMSELKPQLAAAVEKRDSLKSQHEAATRDADRLADRIGSEVDSYHRTKADLSKIATSSVEHLRSKGLIA